MLWYYVAFAAAAYAVTRYRENAELRGLPAARRGTRAGPVGRLAGPRVPSHAREPELGSPVRILHVNKFLYRRGGAEAYMEDLADLQVAAGHTSPFFGMAHPLNTHLEYAAFFPSSHRVRAAATTLSGRVRGVARMLYSTSASRGMDAVLDRLPPGRRAPAQHLPPALAVGAASRRAPADSRGHDPPRLQAGVPDLPVPRPRQPLPGVPRRPLPARGPAPLQGRFAGGQRGDGGRAVRAHHHPRLRAGERVHLSQRLPRGSDARGPRLPRRHAPRPSFHRDDGIADVKDRARVGRRSSPAGCHRRRASTWRFAPWGSWTAPSSTSPGPAPRRRRCAALPTRSRPDGCASTASSTRRRCSG